MSEAAHRIELFISPDLAGRIERWRGRQSVIPPRAAAIRRLVKAGLEAGDAPAPGASTVLVASVAASNVPPLPSGTRSGQDVQTNAKISAGAADQLAWVETALGISKRAALDRLIRDGALRLARELGASPAG